MFAGIYVSSKVAWGVCSAIAQGRGYTQRCFNEETKIVDDLLAEMRIKKCSCWIFPFFSFD